MTATVSGRPAVMGRGYPDSQAAGSADGGGEKGAALKVITIFIDRSEKEALCCDAGFPAGTAWGPAGQCSPAGLALGSTGTVDQGLAGSTGPAGAFYSKFFIGKAMTLSHAGPIFHALPRLGERSSLRKDKPYLLKVEFQASRIALYENDVQQIVAVDKEYQAGQCGLAAWRTQVRFANVRIQKAIPKAFLIMPFDSELDFVHKVIRETLGKYGIKCERADEIAVSRPVMEDVSKEIADADLVIVDFTGRNPNVYFEAGMADAWDKDWILLAQSSEDMTFDVRHIRSIRYRNAMGADIKLAEDLANALSALGYKSRKARQARSRA